MGLGERRRVPLKAPTRAERENPGSGPFSLRLSIVVRRRCSVPCPNHLAHHVAP